MALDRSLCLADLTSIEITNWLIWVQHENDQLTDICLASKNDQLGSTVTNTMVSEGPWGINNDGNHIKHSFILRVCDDDDKYDDDDDDDDVGSIWTKH